jgi:hypothetical protein
LGLGFDNSSIRLDGCCCMVGWQTNSLRLKRKENISTKKPDHRSGFFYE